MMDTEEGRELEMKGEGAWRRWGTGVVVVGGTAVPLGH